MTVTIVYICTNLRIRYTSIATRLPSSVVQRFRLKHVQKG